MEYQLLGSIDFFKKWDAAILRCIKGKFKLNRKETLKFIKAKSYPKKRTNFGYYPFVKTV